MEHHVSTVVHAEFFEHEQNVNREIESLEAESQQAFFVRDSPLQTSENLEVQSKRLYKKKKKLRKTKA